MKGWDIAALIRAGYDSDGYPEAQPDSFGEKDSGVKPSEHHHWYGTWSLPHQGVLGANGLPDPQKCAKLLIATQNHMSHAFALEDPRTQLKLPQHSEGGWGFYGGRLAQPAFCYFEGDTGSFQIYVPYEFDGDGPDAAPTKAMSIGIDVREKGKESISIVHGLGMSATMAAEDKSLTLKNAAGDAFLVLNEDGVVSNGTTILGAPQGGKSLAMADAVIAAIGQLKDAIAAIGRPETAAAVTAKLALVKTDGIPTKLVQGT